MDYYPHLHISDDNQAYPESGAALDFTAIYRKLMGMPDTEGTVAVEGIYGMVTAGGYKYARHTCIKCAAVLHTPPVFPSTRFNRLYF